MPYLIIILVVFIVTPFVLKIVQNQKKANKRNLKNVFLFILTLQFISGLLNWEDFTKGRSGYELLFSFPESYLGLFFVISALQIIFLLINKSLSTLAVILNFINSIIIFVGMIRLSSILEFQAVSFAPIGAVFLVLIGNVVGLAYINRDKNLLKKNT